MGVIGLTQKVKKYKVAHKLDHLNECWCHVDGLNFMQGIAGPFSEEMKDSPYVDFTDRVQHKIRSITRLSPSKITFYFDSMVPKEKVPIRLERLKLKLGTMHRRQVIFADALVVNILTEKFPFIDIVFTGMEAEDEIANVIYSARRGPAAKYRHAIFSSDSDVYTFLLPNASNVEVVPFESLKNHESVVSINLGTIHAIQVVPRKYLRRMPLPHLGINKVKADRVSRRQLEFINGGLVFKQFNNYLPNIHSPEIAEPYKVGVQIRRAFYGIILRRYFEEKFYKITEFGQNNLQMGINVLEPLVGHELDQTMDTLTRSPFDRLIINQLEEVRSKFELDDANIESVGKYVNDMLAGQTISAAKELHSQATKLDSLLRAALVSMHFFYGAVFPEHSKMLCFSLIWKITPYELSRYL